MLSIRVLGKNNQKHIHITKKMREIVKRCCIGTLYVEGYHDNFEVSVTYTDNLGIRELNRFYRGIDRETDVLSFPLMDSEGFDIDPVSDSCMLGDIVISVEKTIEQAIEYGHSFERELAFLTVHSMLHLLGYDHVNSEEEEKEMFERQEFILETLGFKR